MTASCTACIWLKSCQPKLLPAGPGWSARSMMRTGGSLQAHQTGLLDVDTFSSFWRPKFETVAHWSQVWNLVVDPWRMFRWGFTDFTQLHKVIVTRAKTFRRTSLQSDCSPSGISRLSSLLRRFHVWFCYKCRFWKRLSSLRDYLFSCTQKK